MQSQKQRLTHHQGATLIEAVGRRPVLFDPSHPDHNDKQLIRRHWTEIEKETGIEDPATEFGTLKRRYYREKRKLELNSPPSPQIVAPATQPPTQQSSPGVQRPAKRRMVEVDDNVAVVMSLTKMYMDQWDEEKQRRFLLEFHKFIVAFDNDEVMNK